MNERNTDNLLEQERKLSHLALEARERAYAPYSSFKVGAALLASSGKIYCGCNIENASYTPTNCAERTAFFKAVSEGEREFVAIAVAGGSGEVSNICPPCGVCLQVMAEFCDPESFGVYLVKNENESKLVLLKELLPYGFSRTELEK